MTAEIQPAGPDAGGAATWRLEFTCTAAAAVDDEARPEPQPLLTDARDPLQLRDEVHRHMRPLLTAWDFTVWVSLPTGDHAGQGDVHTQRHTLATFTITRVDGNPRP